MRIGYDHQVFVQQRYGGVSRYYAMLAKELAALGHKVRIYAPFYQNRYPEELGAQHLVSGRRLQRLPKNGKHLLWVLGELINRMKNYPTCDLLHETGYGYFSGGRKSLPRVTTVYDMIHEMFEFKLPFYERQGPLMRRAVNRADKVICISKQTKADLVDRYQVDPSKCEVTYLGADHMPRTGSGDAWQRYEQSGGPSAPYLVYVGTRSGPYKNFRLIEKVFELSGGALSAYALVLFGGEPLSPDEAIQLRSCGVREVFQITGNDDLLAAVFNRASALIYPSLYEGFGLPPVEAMRAGCPVIASNTGSIPEILRDAAVYVDPLDSVSSCQIVLEALKTDLRSGGWNERRERISSEYTWRKCAHQTLDIYEAILAARS